MKGPEHNELTDVLVWNGTVVETGPGPGPSRPHAGEEGAADAPDCEDEQPTPRQATEPA